MKVTTVTGDVDVDDLGIILPHEHLINTMDWPGIWPDASNRPDLVWEKVNIENLGALRRNYCAINDNFILDDMKELCKEVELFTNAGGETILEMSTYGVCGNRTWLKEISQKTGVNIIAGTGFYLEESLPKEIKNMTTDQMYNLMMRDITEGFPGTDFRAGIIGEVATSHPMTEIEERSFRAAARVQRDTGLAMNIHIGLDMGMCRKVINILKQEKAEMEKVIFAHCDGPAPIENYREIIDEGIYVEIDCFGHEFYVDNGAYDRNEPWYFPSDGERIRTVKMLVDNGLDDKVVLSQDIGVKMQMVQYGGYGYAHIINNIIPMLEHIGVPKDISYKMMKINTARFLRRE